MILNQDKSIMSTKENSSGKESKTGRATPVPEVNLIPGDLRIKLFNKFEGNKSKLDSFLAQYKLYIIFNKYKFKIET